MRLSDYQLDGIGRLVARERELNAAILADEMGLGKTLQLIRLIIENSLPSPTLFHNTNSARTMRGRI